MPYFAVIAMSSGGGGGGGGVREGEVDFVLSVDFVLGRAGNLTFDESVPN